MRVREGRKFIENSKVHFVEPSTWPKIPTVDRNTRFQPVALHDPTSKLVAILVGILSLASPLCKRPEERQRCAMDTVLDRLWELANEDDGPGSARRDERIAEACALWRSLGVLLVSASAEKLRVGDGAFTKSLACIRSVLSDVDYWTTSHAVAACDEGSPGDEANVSVFACVNLVLDKLAGRGECEREAFVRDGMADLVVRCIEPPPSPQQKAVLTAADAAAALQSLKTLAGDTRTHSSLRSSQGIRACISLMQTHDLVLSVQLRGCQFLQQMTQDEDCKDRVGRHGGLQAAMGALTRFPGDAKLASSALDTMRSVCCGLRNDDGSAQLGHCGAVNSATLSDVTVAVVKSMQALTDTEQVQITGVALLNSVVVHASVKRVLCSLDIWSLAKVSFVRSSNARTVCGFVELLDVTLRDVDTFDTLRSTLTATSSWQSTPGKENSRWAILKDVLQALRDNHIAAEMRPSQASFVSTRLQSLLDEAARPPAGGDGRSAAAPRREEAETRSQSVHSQLFGSVDSERPPTLDQTHDHDEEEFPVDLGGTSDGYAYGTQSDDTKGIVLSDGAGYFEQFLQDTLDEGTETQSVDDCPPRESLLRDSTLRRTETTCDGKYDVSRLGSPSCKLERAADTQRERISAVLPPTTSPDINSDTDTWRALYEASSREIERNRAALRELEERYRIVLRRSQEQAKLLALQNARIGSHTEEHQQVVRRMRVLEASLEDAERRCDVERALRSAESAQCEQLSLALHEATNEVQALTTQQSSVERELRQKEAMRTEYMMRTRESKQDKRCVELERDNAQLQVQLLKQEKQDAVQQLEDCRREGRESLLMREEDVDARRPGIFSELKRLSGVTEASHGGRSTPEVSRRSSLPSQILVEHVMTSPAGSSSFQTRAASVLPMRMSSNGADKDFNDDPEAIGRPEIESCLETVFQSLDTSVDGSGEDGVHVSSVRRFFLESGLVQPPQVQPADVDVVLARVLAQSQSNRKNAPVRKDFSSSEPTWAPPQGWAKNKSRPQRRATVLGDAKRFRFFDQDAFNEATTLIGMRRFPRSDLLRVLQTVVALYLRPYLRQLGPPPGSQRERFSLSSGPTRRYSTSSAGASSPSAVCNRALRAILNGLALHFVNDSDGQEGRRSGLGADLDEGESRHHSNLPVSLRRRYKREDVVYSMLEMQSVLSRELRPLGTICEFYSAQYLPNAAPAAAVAIVKEELFGLSFELLLSFSMDFELIPSFMDRVSLKHLHSEVAGLLKAYFALNNKEPPSATDAETLKKVAFAMILARLALELFGTKADYETPERQITALLQWLDNSAGREKLIRKSHLPIVIRFSRQLYALKQ